MTTAQPIIHTPPAAATAMHAFAKPCRFIASADAPQQLQDSSLPEIAFWGRSNVGKSSLLNAIAGQKKLAHVSQTPGRTRRINVFDCGMLLRLVDLPGYGYGRAAKSDRKAWQASTRAFLAVRVQLRRVLLLIDCRRGIGAMDKEMMLLLDSLGVGWTMVVTKCDKLGQGAVDAVHEASCAACKNHPTAWGEVFMTSVVKNTGIPQLRAHIADLTTQNQRVSP